MVHDRRFSISTLIGPTCSLTFQRLLMVEFCIVYFLGGIQKLNLGFLGGSLLAREMGRIQFSWGAQLAAILGQETSELIQQILLNRDVLIMASMGTVIIELVFPFSLWFRATRAPSIIVGVAFHLAIYFFMNIDSFSIAMIGTYLLFLEPETLPSLFKHLCGRGPATTNREGEDGLSPSEMQTIRRMNTPDI